MVNSAEFAKRLQKILDYYSISATAFSEEIEVNRSTISHLLSGRNKPSLDFVLKVIQHYPEVELYWLLNGKGTFPSVQQLESSKSDFPKIRENSENLSKSDPAVAASFEKKSISKLNTQNSGIERIVVFFKDGSFKSYEN